MMLGTFFFVSKCGTTYLIYTVKELYTKLHGLPNNVGNQVQKTKSINIFRKNALPKMGNQGLISHAHSLYISNTPRPNSLA